MKKSAVYKITNTVTGDFYIGSSKDVERRWLQHKRPSVWIFLPNSPMYLNMQKYGVDKFIFEILAEVEIEQLKEKEQQLIENMKPTYNSNNAKGWNIERYKEHQKSDKRKKYNKKYNKEYQKSYKYKSYKNKYQNQPCFYNGEIITFNTLRMRFRKNVVEHPSKEAKKYLLK